MKAPKNAQAVTCPPSFKVDADGLCRAAGALQREKQALQARLQIACAAYALPGGKTRDAQPPVSATSGKVGMLKAAGDPSVLDGFEGANTGMRAAVDLGFAAQVLTNTNVKLAAARDRFWQFVFPNGHAFSRHQSQNLIKSALASIPVPGLMPGNSQAQTLASAHQQMAGFMKPHAAAPQPSSPAIQGPPATVGTSPVAPGAPTMTGVAQRPIGLDQPCDTRATAVPGTPGHAATNVIDQRGGLDPRGLTVDGNNAAGIKKFGGFFTADELLAAAKLPSNKQIVHEQLPDGFTRSHVTTKEAEEPLTTYHYHCGCGWTGTDGPSEGHPRSMKCPDCGNPAHGGLPTEKSAAVHPFRPVNADPDFIRENQAWHAAEKARIASRDGRLRDPVYRALLGLNEKRAIADASGSTSAPAPAATTSPALKLPSPQSFPKSSNPLQLYQHPSGSHQIGNVTYKDNNRILQGVAKPPGATSGPGVLRVSAHGGGRGTADPALNLNYSIGNYGDNGTYAENPVSGLASAMDPKDTMQAKSINTVIANSCNGSPQGATPADWARSLGNPRDLNRVVMVPPGHLGWGETVGKNQSGLDSLVKTIMPPRDSMSMPHRSFDDTSIVPSSNQASQATPISALHDYRLPPNGNPYEPKDWTDTGVYTDGMSTPLPLMGISDEAKDIGRHLGLGEQLGGGDFNSYTDRVRKILGNPDATYKQKVWNSFARPIGTAATLAQDIPDTIHSLREAVGPTPANVRNLKAPKPMMSQDAADASYWAARRAKGLD